MIAQSVSNLIKALNKDQLSFLSEYDVDPNNLILIEGKQLHQYMIYNNAYTDGEELLVFFEDMSGGSMNEQKSFLYYMGAENEAELTAKHLGITIYENISSERLERYKD